MDMKQNGSERATTKSHGRKFLRAARERTGRMDDGRAFLPDPQNGPPRVIDEFAEQIAESYLESATSGEEKGEEYLDRVSPDEIGGPFIVTTADQEIALGTDSMNPEDGEVEAFPLVTRSP